MRYGEGAEGRRQRAEGREEVIDLFTYDCVDGVVRTRCRKHIATTGPYRMFGKKPYHVRRGVSWWRCVECRYEADQLQAKGGHDDTVVDNVDE